MQRKNPRDSVLNRLLSGLSSGELGILVVFGLVLSVTAATMFCSDAEEDTAPVADAPPGAPPDGSVTPAVPPAGAPGSDAVVALRARAERWRELAEEARARNAELQEELDRLTTGSPAADPGVPRPASPADDEAGPLRRRLAALQRRFDEQAAVLRGRDIDLAAAEAQVADLRVQLDLIARQDAAREAELLALRRTTGGPGPAPPARVDAPASPVSDYPSCWFAADGSIEYVWTIAVRDDGLVLRTAPAPANNALRAGLPLDGVRTGVPLSRQDFLFQTQALHEHGLGLACRYFVRLEDRTTGPGGSSWTRAVETVGAVFGVEAGP